ncbi:hypothetical protein QBC34DRAFT_357167 [Podospora aff. communis PSN243]|uniref:DUF4200 domain-containing protein n=1 Tax=Podospora aff. communis PSN243 TaxID=3040156 RepID=A0AAV9GCM6_9PEZI|nr:hypothetical protein QBC34DRAFT_357167 [Podospora aff. communis PSN243]
MTPLESKIAQAALKNRELLAVLSATDHAPSALSQQRRLVADLQAALDESDRKLAFLEEKRHKEFNEHKAYRDSVMRRYLYKVSGKADKFAEKAKKEETEYFAVLQKEQQYQGVNQDLREQLGKAKEEVRRLEGEVARHEGAQGELDRLYEVIFGGPTEGLPEEDAAEEKVRVAMGGYAAARGRAEEEHMAVSLLGEAQKRMVSALRNMQEALQASTYDMWSSNSFADMMERNALHRAEAETISARMQVVQAQRFSPQVPDLPPVEINQGHLLRDVFFDNVWTDMKFHQEIQKSTARVQQAAARLDQIAADAQGRFGALDAEFRRKEKELHDARAALQKVREAAFERLSEPPPAY